MKKIFMFFGALLLLLSQAHAQDCPFQVQMKVIPATCYNNGMVAYALTDGSGNVLNSNPTSTTPRLQEVRAYYIAGSDTAKHYSGRYLVDINGSMNYATGWDTLTIDYGTYTVGVEAVCWDGANYVKKDTHTVLTIPTTYVKPSASALYVTASTLNGYGKHPTLECEQTGRIQLKVENGRFPYTVTVRRHGTADTFRTLVFYDTMYHGRVATRYDYYLYYSVDSLPAGDWDFYLVDGCGYGLPRTGQTVDVIDFPTVPNSNITLEGTTRNLNKIIVRFKTQLDKNDPYLTSLMPEYAEYRFINDGVATAWKPYPASYSTYLYDTLLNTTYCDLRGNTVTLEFRHSCLNANTSKTVTFKASPGSPSIKSNFTVVTDTSYVDSEDSCVLHTKQFILTRYYAITGKSYPYFTPPLTYTFTDTQKDSVIKSGQIDSLPVSTYLYDSEVEAIYGPFHDSTRSHPLRVPIKWTVTDANGCVLNELTDTLDYYYDSTASATNCCSTLPPPPPPSWSITSTNGDNCCTTAGSVKVTGSNYPSDSDLDGTTIVLEESPHNNRYNFTAVYSSATQSWTIHRNNIENTALIMGSASGLSMILSDYCIPSGPYGFRIMTPYDTFTLQKNISFPAAISTEMTQEPAYVSSQHCTDHYITYTAGSFANVSRGTSLTTGLPLSTSYTPISTCFQVVDGPIGGYEEVLHNAGEDIRISMPGQYVIRIMPCDTEGLCNLVVYYDTIDYDGATVEFEYAYAYLCDSTSTSGTAYIKGINGTPPYHYTLYDSTDKQGNIIGDTIIADPNIPAVFANRAMDSRHQLSCKIEDDCGAYFHVNFYPLTLADVQKLWFDGGLTATETCEGSTIQVHALEISSVLKYEWYNPRNELIDSVSSPSIFIPRHAEDGWYKVVIRNSGCQDSIVDSVRLTVRPAPTIDLNGDKLLCPGEETELEFTPTSYTGADSLSFTIAFENADGVEERTYKSASGEAVTDLYMTYTYAKIYPLSVNDGNCDYTLADEHDTIYIRMRNDLADACTIIGSRDTVCFGSDARFAARSTVEPPYTLRWYSDYELTNLLQEDVITSSTDTSFYDTLALTHHAEVFVTIDKEGYCPTVYGQPTKTVNFATGNTVIACGQVIRLYDEGGAEGDYTPGGSMLHTYTTTDGKPVTIRFEELDLSETAHLFVITGSDPNPDSVLYNLTAGSPNPGVITSNGNALTLYFMPGQKAEAGWKAIVEHSPGMSIADVWSKNEVVIRDAVCQSQTNTYEDPYHVVPDVVADINTLTRNIRKAGTYYYKKIIPTPDIHGCDSTVTFILSVNPPPHRDTTVVITNLMVEETGGYVWPANGRTYTQSGRYTKRTELAGGCDSLDFLDLIVLQIDTTTNEICTGETTQLGVTVTVPELNNIDELVLPSVKIGDVLCNDGSVLNVDSFLAKDPTAESAIGVVFYVDQSGLHGRAIALRNAYPDTIHEITVNMSTATSVPLYSGQHTAWYDMNGETNTLRIKQWVETRYSTSREDFLQYAPAAYYCYYFDHNTLSTGYTPLGWYLPSAGELNTFAAHALVVNNTLQTLHNHRDLIATIARQELSNRVDYSGYYSSTLQNRTTGKYWFFTHEGNVDITGRGQYDPSNKYTSHFVRAIIKF